MGSLNSKKSITFEHHKEALESKQSSNMTWNESAVRGIDNNTPPIKCGSCLPHESPKKIKEVKSIIGLCKGLEKSNDLGSIESHLNSNLKVDTVINNSCIDNQSDISTTDKIEDKESLEDDNNFSSKHELIKIKKEVLCDEYSAFSDKNYMLNKSSKAEPGFKNATDTIFVDDTNFSSLENLKDKLIKQELLNGNTMATENKFIYSTPSENGSYKLPQDSTQPRNAFAVIKRRKLMEKAFNHESINNFEFQCLKQPIEENINASEIIVKPEVVDNIGTSDIFHNKVNTTTKWIKNPFALITSAAKLALLESIEKTNCSVKTEALNSFTKLKVARNTQECYIKKANLWSNNFSGVKVETKCEENNCLDGDSDRNSDFCSLSDASFYSLSQINNETASQSLTKCTDTTNWMVQLPENPREPAKSNACISAKTNNKCNAGIKYFAKQTTKRTSNAPNINKQQTNRSRKSKSSTKINQKYQMTRQNPKKKSKRRLKLIDKTYSCPIPAVKLMEIKPRSYNGRKRACRKEHLNHKRIASFPKPMQDEKPQIVRPPAPIQVQVLKTESLDIKMEELKYESKKTVKVDRSLTPNSNSLENSISNEVIQNQSASGNCIKTESSYVFDKITTYNVPFNSTTHIYGTNSDGINDCDIKPNYKVSKQFSSSQSPIYIKQESNTLSAETSLEEDSGKLFERLQKEQPHYSRVLEQHSSRLSEGKHQPFYTNIKCESMLEKGSPITQLSSKAIKKYMPLVSTKFNNKKIPQCNKLLKCRQIRVHLNRCDKYQSSLQKTQQQIKRETAINKSNTDYFNDPVLNFINKFQHNCKLLQPKVRIKRLRFPQGLSHTQIQKNISKYSQYTCKSWQPKVRIKRLNFLIKHFHSLAPHTDHEVGKVAVSSTHLNLQPIVRLKRLKIYDSSLEHSVCYNENFENYNKQLTVDLEVNRECEFYEMNAELLASRSHNKGGMRIKEEKLSPTRCNSKMVTSPPTIRIAKAFSLHPVVRVKRLKCANIGNNGRFDVISPKKVNSSELGVPIKIESLEFDDEEMTPLSIGKQYERHDDSGVSLDSAYNERITLDNSSTIGNISNKFPHAILFEIALQRAIINDLLLRNGFSPIHFRLYNNIEDLKTFLNYLVDESL